MNGWMLLQLTIVANLANSNKSEKLARKKSNEAKSMNLRWPSNCEYARGGRFFFVKFARKRHPRGFSLSFGVNGNWTKWPLSLAFFRWNRVNPLLPKSGCLRPLAPAGIATRQNVPSAGNKGRNNRETNWNYSTPVITPILSSNHMGSSKNWIQLGAICRLVGW